MSESSQESSGSNEQQWPSKDSGGSKSRPILLGILAIMLVALGYDYLVARPAVRDAYDKIAEASVEMNARGASSDSGEVDFLTNKDVQELLGREPNSSYEDGKYHIEVYNFMGGLIVKPHKLFTVYRKSGEGWMFSRHSSFVYDKPSDIGREGGVIAIDSSAPMDDEEYEEGTGDSSGGMSGPGEPEDSGETRSRPEMESDEEPAEEPDAAPAEEPAEEAASEE